MTSKFSIDNRELLQRISSGEAVVGIDFGNLIVRELAAFRLTAMDSEPVAYIFKHPAGRLFWSLTDKSNKGHDDVMPVYASPQPAPIVEREPIAWLNDAYLARGVVDGEAGSEDAGPGYIPVYRHAQPAPVVPDEIKHRIGGLDWGWEGEFNRGWNACRAAMLQAEPVCTCPSGDGSLRWPCPVHPGSSPVIPDGWTCNDKANAALMMLDRIETVDPVDDDRIDGIKRIVRELAAAPHDTPALNSVQSVVTVPGKWIPVSEQMPPSRHEVLVGRWWGEKPRWCCKWATYIPGHPDAQSSGWLIPGASWTPTHWMPLPAAPQEPSPVCISKRSQHLS